MADPVSQDDILNEEYDATAQRVDADFQEVQRKVGQSLMAVPEGVRPDIAAKWSRHLTEIAPDFPDAEAFAAKKAEALVAKFPDTTDGEIDAILQWGIERQGLNRARANARRLAGQTGLENAGLLTQAGALASSGVMALANKATMGLSDTAVKALAGEEAVEEITNLRDKTRQTFPTGSAIAETTGALAGFAVSPFLRGAQAAAGLAVGRGVAQGALAFGGYEAATQAVSSAAGTGDGRSPLEAGINGAIMGGVLAAAAPRLDMIAKAIGGRGGEAVKGALENVVLMAAPHATTKAGLEWHVPSFQEAAGTTLVMAAFGGARGAGLSDPMRRELIKRGLTPEQADAIAPVLRESLERVNQAPPAPDPALLEPAKAAHEAATGKKIVEPVAEAPVTEAPKPVEAAREPVAEVARPPDPVVVEPPKPTAEVAPAPEAAAPQGVTSIKNRVVNEERAAMGVGPVEETAARGWGEVGQRALEVVKQDPMRPQALAREIVENPRPHTDVEAALLAFHRLNLKRSYDSVSQEGSRAAALGDKDAAVAAADRARLISDELLQLDQATKIGGAETARGLAARRAFVTEQYELVDMLNRRRAENDYEALTREQMEEVASLHAQLAKATADRDAYAGRVEELEKQRATALLASAPRERAAPGSPEYGKRNTLVTREAYEQTRAALREKLSRLNAGLDPTILADMVKLGAFHVEAGVRDFATWAKAMTDDLGERVKPHLKDVWAAARKQDADALTGKARAALEAGFASGRTPADMQINIGKLAEYHLREGVRGREALVDAVHADLKELSPKITRRETMDALSGYGRTKELDSDPVKVELRDIKAQLQQIAKLEDMAKGQPPLKSGLQREAPSDAQRELTKLVNEAKRKGGYSVRDEATQLRTALSSVKARLTHQISDLEKQIATRTKTISDRTKLEYDAEAKDLKARRDALKAEYDTIFGKAGATEQQKIDAAIKATERSIADYEKRIAAGDVFPAAPGPKPTNAKLEALRAQRDALRQKVEDIRFSAMPHKTAQAVALQRLKSQLKTRARQLQERIDSGNLETPERAEIFKDKEAVRLEAEVEAVKRKFHLALLTDRLNKRTTAQKISDTAFMEVPNFMRSVMTSLDFSAVFRQGGFAVLGHPVMAARALPDMFRAFASREGHLRAETELALRPSYNLAVKSGLFLAEHGPARFSRMEEQFMSRWAEKVPLVAGSQRAYIAFLNRLRMDSFDALTAGLAKDGRPTKAEAQAIAGFVNVATGRGGGKESAKLAALNNVFFSPRLVASRFQLLAGAPAWGGTARTRVAVAKEYARFLAGVGVIYALGSMMGGEIEHDPRSSDFGKIRFGDTRVDPLTGISQATVVLARAASGETKTLGGKIRSLRGDDVKFGGENVADVTARFLRTKLAPIPSALVDMAAGEDVVGKDTSLGQEATGLVTPLAAKPQEILPIMEAHGVPKGAALWLLSMFGMGVSHYAAQGGNRPPRHPR